MQYKQFEHNHLEAEFSGFIFYHEEAKIGMKTRQQNYFVPHVTKTRFFKKIMSQRN